MSKIKQVKTILKDVCLVALAISLLYMFTAGVGTEDYTPASADVVEPQLLGKNNNRMVILLKEAGELAAYYKDLPGEDSQLVRVDDIEDGQVYFLDGGTVGIAKYEEDELVFTVTLYDLDANLEYKDSDWCRYDFYFEDDYDFAFANIGEGIYTIYILSPEGKLWSCETLSEPEETDFSDVSFLNSTPGGWIYVYADGTLFRWKGDGIEDKEEYTGAPCPQSMVGENVYVDETGILIRLDGMDFEPVNLGIDGLNPKSCHATDEYVIAADSSGVVHKFDWSGEDIIEIGRTQVDGEIYGIIDDYILTVKDGQIDLSELVFESAEPTPTPEPGEEEEPTPPPSSNPSSEPTPSPSHSPTPSPIPTPSSTPTPIPTPSPTPSPSPKPPVVDDDEIRQLIEEFQFKELTGENGKYIALLCGARVSDLRKIYHPDTLDVFTSDNKPVHESILKTGMKIQIRLDDGTVDETTVIVRGDCTCDGKLTKSDIRFASLYIIDAEYTETEAQFMAMDMNDDGQVTIWDLPQIADEIKRMEKTRS